MSNVNSVADVIMGQNNSQPIVLSSTTTLHQSFSIGGAVAVLSLPNPLALIDADQVFPGRAAQAIPFKILAAGTVTGGEQFTIDINQGSGLTPSIASTGAINLGVQNDNWLIEATCLWDAASQKLRGLFYSFAGNIFRAPTALVNSTPAALSNLTFNCAVTISTANANASFSLTEFSASLM